MPKFYGRVTLKYVAFEIEADNEDDAVRAMFNYLHSVLDYAKDEENIEVVEWDWNEYTVEAM